jgi:NADH-quinone oxidoreductase subunit G
MAYGVDSSRFKENKRAVEDKYVGVLVKTIMNRCIHCTRCVRFMTEVAGVPELGAIGRGEDTEITTYLEHAMTSELQGNVVDLCPVGALTSKPYAFAARPWELNKAESVDVMDALGSAIRIDTRGREVMRILPRVNDDVNEEWISDKTRHVVDGLRAQRLDQPYIREGGQLYPASWRDAFDAIAAKVDATEVRRIGAIVGDLATVEETFALKDLMTRLGVVNLDCRQDGAVLDPAWGRASYLFNATIAGIDKADALLIVAANPRREAAVLNARIRKRWRIGAFPVGLIGERADLTYRYDYLGAGPQTLADVAAGAHEFASVLKKAERPVVIVGMSALARPDGAAIASLAARAAQVGGSDGWNGFSVLHTAAARVGALDVGFVPGACSCSVPTRSISPPGPSWSISAPTEMRARTAPMSSFRARPIPRNLASTSTPRGACRWLAAPPSHRATHVRTGQSCGRCRMCSTASLLMTRLPSCVRRCSRRIPTCSASIRPRPPSGRILLRWPRAAAPSKRPPSAAHSTTSISPIRSRGRPRSWRNAR